VRSVLRLRNDQQRNRMETLFDTLPVSGHIKDEDAGLTALLSGSDTARTFSPEWASAARRAICRENDARREALAGIGFDHLPEGEKHAILVLAARMARFFTDAISIDEDDSPSSIVRGAAALVGRGLAVRDDGGRYLLSVSAARAFFSGEDAVVRYDGISRLADVVPASAIEPRALYYPSAVQEPVQALRRVLSPEGYGRACAVLRRKGRRAAVTALLYGAPGTGKTELVRQLAREGGRTVIAADVSKMTASGWGDTEKGYRGLFREYAYLAAVSSVAPVLLLNEADQLLARRMAEVRQSIDKSENAVADIVLQEMENMDGILLATTNLAAGMDPAFDRRFLFKIEVPGPDMEARALIWHDLMPDLPQDDVRSLARDFALSGGQIANVAARRDLAEIYRDDVGTPFVRSLCEDETRLRGGGRQRRAIGYS